MWFGYAGAARLPGWSVLLPELARGARYDAAVAGGWACVVLVFSLPLLLLPARVRGAVAKVGSVLLLVLLLLFGLLSACEFYYYGFYHSRFDPVVFGLFEDDTSAVAVTIWHAYPVMWGLLGLLLSAVLLYWIFKRGTRWITGRLSVTSPWARVLLIVGQLLLLALITRGSLGTFPLIRQDVVFSPDPFDNQLVLNAPLTLYKAVRVREREIDIGSDPQIRLHELGFRSPKDAAAALGLAGGGDDQIASQLFATVPGAASGTRPNVVLALLESFGFDVLHVDGPDNDMLGRLRPHLAHDYLFTNFITGQNGTHPELENLLLGSSITPLTLGNAGRIALSTSAAIPFRQAGYRTVFVYGGGADWRNIGKVFKRQGFEEIYDQADIRARYPQAGSSAWGVYDEYLFRFARDILDKAEAQHVPVFLFVLTTTNHPPYTLDTPHAKLPINPALLGTRGNPDMALRRRILTTYQYQADQFGAFLDGIEASPLAADTIVAGAGDHNLRDHYRYALPAEQPDVDRVVGFFRLPPALRPEHVDTARFAGHEDMLPTLVNLAIPGGRYFNTGVNLFGPPTADDHGLAMFQRVYLPQGVAFGLGHPQWHPWTVPYTRIAAQGEPVPAAEAPVLRKVAAGVALRDWYIRTQVLDARKPH
ncbi:LTA synthase family protein [Rhodanobacter sp. AS-Z3]|uniref:LTA synthase family protein n=1 Tax=Rhodanobacter sp. AS-Z3 TaxID=3031330 RepID=UPI00247A7AE9|nr:LTA synthase family protein [Rhodanobacter sp. AS-Z3]WEN16862.1 LTA synthase family protein [Rhodanobacter sp. AS-Z3]